MPGLFFFHYLVHTWYTGCMTILLNLRCCGLYNHHILYNHLCYQLKDNDSFLSLRIFILYLKNSYTYLNLEFYYKTLLDMHEKKSKINGLKYSQTFFISKVWFSWITSQFRISKPMYYFNMYWDITSNDEVIFLEGIL